MVRSMKTLISKFTNYYRRNNLLDEETIQKMEYTINSFINEFSKFIIFSILFLLLDKYLCFLFCYLTFVTLRVFSGGIHCNGYWSCFIVSLLSFFIFIYTPEYINFNTKRLIIIAILSILFQVLFSPVLPKIRKIKNKKIILRLKIFSTITTTFWITLCYHLINIPFVNSILLAILLGNIQLIIPVIIKFLGKEKKKHEKIP